MDLERRNFCASLEAGKLGTPEKSKDCLPKEYQSPDSPPQNSRRSIRSHSTPPWNPRMLSNRPMSSSAFQFSSPQGSLNQVSPELVQKSSEPNTPKTPHSSGQPISNFAMHLRDSQKSIVALRQSSRIGPSQSGDGEKYSKKNYGSNTVRRLRSQMLKLKSQDERKESSPKVGSNRTIIGSSKTKRTEELAASGMAKGLMSIWKKVSGYEDSSPGLAPVKKSKSKTIEGEPSKSSDCPKEIEANLSESKNVDSKDRES